MSIPEARSNGLYPPAPSAPIRTLPESVITQMRTNYIPSAIEKVQISQRLAEAQTELTRYDAEISGLRPTVGPLEQDLCAIVNQVEQERAALRVYIDAYRCLQAPIRTLPTELLAEIFLLCKPDWLFDPVNRSTGQMPVKIGQVCTRWRTVVLSLEEVWSSIYLAPALKDKDAHTTSALETYVTRSGTHPLSITVPKDPPVSLGILIQESHRWRSVNLNLDLSDYSLVELFAPIRGNLPLLEELTIAATLSEPDFFTVCPKLRSLNLQLGLYGAAPNFPQDQISTLTVTSGNAIDTLVCASRYNNLQHLAVSGFRFERSQSGERVLTGHPITHNLVALTLTLFGPEQRFNKNLGCYKDGISFLLENLTLPCLKSLELQCRVPIARGWEFKLLHPFLRRSSCALETLALRCTAMEEFELAALLTLTPTLRSLKLDRLWYEDDLQPLMGSFAKILTIPRAAATYQDSIEISPVLVPQLTHLDLAVVNPHIDEMSIVEMVKSRRPRIGGGIGAGPLHAQVSTLSTLSTPINTISSDLECVAITFLNRTRVLHPNFRRRMLALSLGGLEVTLLEPGSDSGYVNDLD